MSHWYDRDGHKIGGVDELIAWQREKFGGEDSEKYMEYRRVGRTILDPETGEERPYINGCITISTVWLGLDHQYGDGPPIIFETLVFDGPDDGEMDRYHTLAEAEAGHAATVAIQKVRIRARRGDIK